MYWALAGKQLCLCEDRYSLLITYTTQALLPALLCLVVVYQGLSPRASG